MSHIVWVPGPQLEELGELPAGYEAVALPEDIAADPHVRDVEFIVVRLQDDLNQFYALMPSLRVVQTVSAGVDSFIDGFPEHLTLCSARGTHDVDVAEWVVGAILAGQRGFPIFRDEQRAGRWTRTVTLRTQDSTVLLVGYGSIAKVVESRLAPFGVRILRVARQARDGVLPESSLHEALSEADVVVILCPLTPSTLNLIDAAAIAKMRDDALLINAARGAIVDTDALVEALRSGRIRAVLDSTEPEPLPRDHPLYSLSGAFVTPHIAGTTKYMSGDVYALITEQIRRYAADEQLLNIVDGDY
jgi:phosphoglycerate dehydrogenase-like enzyme